MRYRSYQYAVIAAVASLLVGCGADALDGKLQVGVPPSAMSADGGLPPLHYPIENADQTFMRLQTQEFLRQQELKVDPMLVNQRLVRSPVDFSVKPPRPVTPHDFTVTDGGAAEITLPGLGADMVVGLTLDNPTPGTASVPVQNSPTIEQSGHFFLTPMSGGSGSDQPFFVSQIVTPNKFSQFAGDGTLALPMVQWWWSANGGAPKLAMNFLAFGGNFTDAAGNSSWLQVANLSLTGGLLSPLVLARNAGAPSDQQTFYVASNANQLQLNAPSTIGSDIGFLIGGVEKWSIKNNGVLKNHVANETTTANCAAPKFVPIELSDGTQGKLMVCQ